MKWIRREWTAAEADDWTKEDFFAMFFSSIAYLALMIGSVLVLIAPLTGMLALGLSACSAAIMFLIIDPKLRVLSADYEEKQSAYLRDLDQLMKWKDQ